MYPSFFIGSIEINLFDVMMIVGIIACVITTVLILEKKEKTDKRTVNSILTVGVVSGVAMYLGAYLLNSLFHSIGAGKIEMGGITWLGGVLIAFPTMVILLHFFCPRIKGSALHYFGLIMPGVAIGHAFGRIGCFFAGCCYGAETDCFLGVCFPGMAHPVLPTQLFEAAFEFLMFAAMLVFYKKLRKHFLETYMIGYGVFRFVMEFFRADDRGSTGFFLTPSQLISIIMVVAAVLLILYYKGVLFKKTYAKMASYRKEAEKYGVYMRGDVDATVRQLKGLQKDGVITQEEFEQAKTTLYNRL